MTWFTPATARRLLKRIRPTIETLHRIYLELERRRPRYPASDRPVDPVYFAMSSRLATGLARLRADGLRVDEFRHGRVDFPALLGERLVMLCWHVGEPDLGFWHEPGDGERRYPLPAADPPPSSDTAA